MEGNVSTAAPLFYLCGIDDLVKQESSEVTTLPTELDDHKTSTSSV